MYLYIKIILVMLLVGFALMLLTTSGQGYKMNSILVYLIVTLFLGQFSLVVKSCAEDEDKITLFVSTQFFEQSVKSASLYSKTVKS